MSKNRWAFKIDYARAIAEDSSEIAQLTAPMYVALCASVTDAQYSAVRATGFSSCMAWIDHLTYNVADKRWHTREERAPLLAIVGLTVADLHAMAVYLDNYELAEHLSAELAPETLLSGPSLYRAGKALCEAHAWLIEPHHYRTEAQRRVLLSKARASLARHKRNAAKHG